LNKDNISNPVLLHHKKKYNYYNDVNSYSVINIYRLYLEDTMVQYSKNYIVPKQIPLRGGSEYDAISGWRKYIHLKDRSFWKRRYNKRFRQKTKPQTRKK